jgi:hypothetical protein
VLREKRISFSDLHLHKPQLPVFSTDEGLSIRQSDPHSRNPQISLNDLSDKDITCFNHFRQLKSSIPMISIESSIARKFVDFVAGIDDGQANCNRMKAVPSESKVPVLVSINRFENSESE